MKPQASVTAVPVRPLLDRLLRRQDLERGAASALLDALVAPDVSEAEIAAVLIALAAKGETAEELAGIAAAMRARVLPVRSAHRVLLDTAGTGGSKSKTVNVSTAAALVAAGAGVAVAKHGNRAVTSNSGSADLLHALGVRFDCEPPMAQRCLDELGFCFLFAPLYHRATARIAGVRRQLGVRTIFNLLGPLTNPAGASRQVVGVGDAAWLEPMAQALAALGTEHAWVVHGTDGLDELTVTGPTRVAEVMDGKVRAFEVGPVHFGLARADIAPLRVDGASASAALVRSVLAGERRDAARSLVQMNAAAALFVAGAASDLKLAAKLAAESLDSGAALGKLEALVAMTQEAA